MKTHSYFFLKQVLSLILCVFLFLACSPKDFSASSQKNVLSSQAFQNKSSIATPTSSSSSSVPSSSNLSPLGQPTTDAKIVQPQTPSFSHSKEDAVSYKRFLENRTYEIIPFPQGALVLWSEYESTLQKSRIFGQRVNPLGERQGTPQLFRVTSGQVVLLKAYRSSGKIWISWLSKTSEGKPQSDPPLFPEYFVAALLVKEEGLVPEEPIKIHTFRASWIGLSILPIETGEVLIASSGADAWCPESNPTDQINCSSWDTFALSKDKKVRKLFHDYFLPSMFPYEITTFQKIKGAALVSTRFIGKQFYQENLWIGYRNTNPLPSFDPDQYQKPVNAFFWTGSQLVSLQTHDGKQPGEGGCPPFSNLSPLKQEKGCYPLTFFSPKSKKSVHLLSTRFEEKCIFGHPVVKISYVDKRKKSGSLMLDPLAKGASMNLFPNPASTPGKQTNWIWTGSRLVTVDSDGHIQTRRCLPSGQLETTSMSFINSHQ